MGVTDNYDRDKLVVINDTPIDIVVKADEGATPTPADLAGDNGILHFEFEGDADESGGVALENLFKGTLEIEISVEGLIKLKINVIEVQGDATEVVKDEIIIQHSQLCDAWQSGAGRARQV